MPVIRQSVILRHARRADTHYDWLIESPDQPAGRGKLIAFRAPLPPEHWPAVGVVPLLRLPDHRRRYLTHQGQLPLSAAVGAGADRGRVTRIAQGHAIIHLWTPSRAIIRFTCFGRPTALADEQASQSLAIAIELRPMNIADERYYASVTPAG